MMHTFCRSAVTATLLMLATAANSAATIRVGATSVVIAAPSRGNAVAYDPINHVYLVVSSNGVVYGRFVDRSGNPAGGPFPIQGNTGLFGMYPRATFARDANGGAGGFLVDWIESDGPSPVLHARMVAFGVGGPYGADNAVANDGTWWEEAAYGAYSTANHEFLLVYRTTGSFILRGVRVDLNAAPVGPPFTISQTGQYENNPSVAYNPVTNQYLVCWQDFTAANTGLLYCRFVLPGSGTLGGGPILVQATGSVWFTDTTYNPATNQFLVTWDETHGTATLGRLVNADGSLPGNVIPISTLYAGYDGTATAYNSTTGSFFVVAYNLVGDQTQDGGVELNGAGQPKDSGLQVTSICAAGFKCGNYYPQIAGSTDDANWLVTTATSFVETSMQLIQGSGTGGGGGTPPPPAQTPKPILALDTPKANATVSMNGFVVAGWAVDAGATAGTGVDVIAVWAFPSTGGAAILAGVAKAGTSSYGMMRSDVANYLGAQFAPSGYGLYGTLPAAGNYTLAVYAHSTVTNSWTTPAMVNVTATAPPSHPIMWVDLPAENQNITQNVTVAGWAVDISAPSGDGIGAIHVWAYPQGSSTPVFVGATTVGGARPDIAAWLGPQFGSAGYSLTGTLAPGAYTLVVYAQSTVTGTFNNAKAVDVIVR